MAHRLVRNVEGSLQMGDRLRPIPDETKRLLDPSWPPRPRAGYENMAGLYFDNVGQPQEAREHPVALLTLPRQLRSDSTELTGPISAWLMVQSERTVVQ